MILPDLAELVALRGAAHGSSLHAHRPALARLQGAHRSAQRGRGLEFEEVRPYTPGDDARNIDWRVTARRGQPHTKLFREERERPVWLLADLHPGLYFGSRRQFKSALLLRSAALLAWVAVRRRRPAGRADRRRHEARRAFFRRAPGRPACCRCSKRWPRLQPRAPGAPARDSLNTALTTLRPLLQPGSLVLVLSDFSALDACAEAVLAALSVHSDCRLLWLADPLESSGLPAGRYRAGLPGRLWWLDGERSRATWQAQWAAREQRLDDLARRLSLPLIRLDTADAGGRKPARRC